MSEGSLGRHRALKNAILKCRGFRCRGLGLPQVLLGSPRFSSVNTFGGEVLLVWVCTPKLGFYLSGPKFEKQPKHKVFGRDIPGPRRRDIPDKNFMQVAFSCCCRQGVAGMSRDWVGTSRIWKNFMQENFGLMFRTLIFTIFFGKTPASDCHNKLASLNTTSNAHDPCGNSVPDQICAFPKFEGFGGICYEACCVCGSPR